MDASVFPRCGNRRCGVDVGEAYGSPDSHAAFNALYDELTKARGFAKKACLFGEAVVDFG